MPFDEWYAALAKSIDGLHADSEVEMTKHNPALKILDFFAAANEKMHQSEEAMGLPRLDTSLAQRMAPSLGPDKLKQLSADDALSWVRYWQRVGAV